jgi:hypothetical protein
MAQEVLAVLGVFAEVVRRVHRQDHRHTGVQLHVHHGLDHGLHQRVEAVDAVVDHQRAADHRGVAARTRQALGVQRNLERPGTSNRSMRSGPTPASAIRARKASRACWTMSACQTASTKAKRRSAAREAVVEVLMGAGIVRDVRRRRSSLRADRTLADRNKGDPRCAAAAPRPPAAGRAPRRAASPLASSARASRWAWLSFRRRPAPLQQRRLASSSAWIRLLRAIRRSGVCALVVALVRGGAQHAARQQSGVGLERHALRIAFVQARQAGTAGDQARHARVQHEGHRRVDPFHARARPGRAVGGPVGELAAGRTRVAEGGEGVADLFARQAA